MTALIIATVLHLLAAILWVGGALTLHFYVRPALLPLAPGPRLAAMHRILNGFFPAVALAIPVLLASGLWLVKARYGGFADSPPAIHAMTGIGLLMSAIFATIWFGPWTRMRAAIKIADLAGAGKALGQIRPLVLTNMLLGLLTAALGAAGRYL